MVRCHHLLKIFCTGRSPPSLKQMTVDSSEAIQVAGRYDLGLDQVSVLRSDDVIVSFVAGGCLHRPASGSDGDRNEADETTRHGCRHLNSPL